MLQTFCRRARHDLLNLIKSCKSNENLSSTRNNSRRTANRKRAACETAAPVAPNPFYVLFLLCFSEWHCIGHPFIDSVAESRF